MGDWYPSSRDAQIHLVETWLLVFQTKAAGWGIPAANVTDLTAALAAAKEILAVVKSGERTAVSVVQCNAAFKELETEARFIKKRWLLVPPLTAWFCARYENSKGEAGEWGPVVSAVIP
jgi:hypothetical protein